MHATPQRALDPFTAQQRWAGVVSIDRPDVSRLPHVPFQEPQCRVASARAIEFNGMRAILVHVPYSMVKHFFQSDDEDQVFVAASLSGEHLQFHERADFREWAHFSASHN